MLLCTRGTSKDLVISNPSMPYPIIEVLLSIRETSRMFVPAPPVPTQSTSSGPFPLSIRELAHETTLYHVHIEDWGCPGQATRLKLIFIKAPFLIIIIITRKMIVIMRGEPSLVASGVTI